MCTAPALASSSAMLRWLAGWHHTLTEMKQYPVAAFNRIEVSDCICNLLTIKCQSTSV
jgi:hypothetical protein